MANKVDKDNYCKNCKRSIYGEYKNCDVNIENNGKYVAPPNQECGCKIAEVKGDKKYGVEVITRGNCMICGKELTEGLFLCKECEDKAKSRK